MSFPGSWLCNEQLQDPMSHIYGFLATAKDQQRLRNTCTFLHHCLDHAHFLEAEVVGFFCSTTAADVDTEAGTSEGVGMVPCSSPSFLVQNRNSELAKAITSIKVSGVKDFDGAHPAKQETGRASNVYDYGVFSAWSEDYSSTFAFKNQGSLTPFPSLVCIMLTDLPGWTDTGTDFLRGSLHLRNVTLARLPSLVTLGRNFLEGCPKLQTMTIQDLPSLLRVGEFMNNCDDLKMVRFLNLPKLKFIGGYLLNNCPRLAKLEFLQLPAAEHTGADFLTGTPTTDIVVDAGCHEGLKTVVGWRLQALEFEKLEAEDRSRGRGGRGRGANGSGERGRQIKLF